MAINKPFDRHFVTLGGGVKTTGGSLTLGKGQVALVNVSKTTVNGAEVVSSTAGISKRSKVLEIREGVSVEKPTRSLSNAGKSTPPFSLEEVRKVRVSAPKTTKAEVDEVVIGFDGFDPNTSFNFTTGDRYFNVAVELTGGLLQYLGSPCATEMVFANVDITRCNSYNKCEDCDDCEPVDCKEVTLEAIEQMKNHEVRGGIKVSEIVDITPVFKCDNGLPDGSVFYTYYTLSVCDTGEDDALALVQAQYAEKVRRKDRIGGTSVYEILKVGASPSNYVQTIASVIKGCSSCPDGYLASASGFVYAVTLEDDGTDNGSTISSNLASSKFVSGTVIKSGNDNGVGFYTAVYNSKITTVEIESFLNSAGIRKTATVTLVGETVALCNNSSTTSIAWVSGATCSAIENQYSIVLKDTECGTGRLEELQGAYPNLNIGYYNATLELTVTGSSGNRQVNILGTNYQLSYSVSASETADNFVSSHGATLLGLGVEVSSDSGVLTFTAFSSYVLSGISLGSGTLTATLGSVTPQDSVACQQKYATNVLTNIVCDECDDVFLDYYRSEAPAPYDGVEWVGNDVVAPSGNCLCGIRIVGKMFYLEGNEALRDVVGFTETSVKVQASANFPTDEIREGIGVIPKGVYVGKYLSRFKPRTHLAGNMLDLERMSDAYFLDASRYNYLGRILTGTTSNFTDLGKQYVDYVVEIAHSTTTQGFAKQHEFVVDYHILAEVGRHQSVEDLVNDIAANAGVETVRAF